MKMTILRTTILIKTQFAGLHFYPEAPDAVDFLKLKHRHMFHVTLEIAVKHDDRELEFFMVKEELNKLLKVDTVTDLGSRSCEVIAKAVIGKMQELYGANRHITVTVMEDDENGARVVCVPQ
jgi:hypothetical protein